MGMGVLIVRKSVEVAFRTKQSVRIIIDVWFQGAGLEGFHCIMYSYVYNDTYEDQHNYYESDWCYPAGGEGT